MKMLSVQLIGCQGPLAHRLLDRAVVPHAAVTQQVRWLSRDLESLG